MGLLWLEVQCKSTKCKKHHAVEGQRKPARHTLCYTTGAMQLLSSRNRLLLPGSSSSSSSSRLLLLPAINRHHGFISTRNTRCLIACARGRRASPDPAQQDEEQHVPLTEQPSSPSPTVVPPLVRSRQGAAAAKRNARGSSLRSVVSPVQTLREKGILDVDESG